jgi:hypothetical protein
MSNYLSTGVRNRLKRSAGIAPNPARPSAVCTHESFSRKAGWRPSSKGQRAKSEIASTTGYRTGLLASRFRKAGGSPLDNSMQSRSQTFRLPPRRCPNVTRIHFQMTKTIHPFISMSERVHVGRSPSSSGVVRSRSAKMPRLCVISRISAHPRNGVRGAEPQKASRRP